MVTYPKSGTTWVAFFLAHLIGRRSEGRPVDLDLATCRRWVPDANPEYFGRRPLRARPGLQPPRVFTVHAQFDPALPRVVYLVRDPRAVMVSYHHFLRATRPKFDLSLAEFVERNDAWPCDWGRHVAGWTARAREDRVLVLRYEDLRADPLTGFARIARFCHLDPSPAELEECCGAASFENMVHVERKQHSSEGPFVRRGAVDGWRDELDGRSIRQIETRYAEIMRVHGYAPVAARRSGPTPSRADRALDAR